MSSIVTLRSSARSLACLVRPIESHSSSSFWIASCASVGLNCGTTTPLQSPQLKDTLSWSLLFVNKHSGGCQREIEMSPFLAK